MGQLEMTRIYYEMFRSVQEIDPPPQCMLDSHGAPLATKPFR